jgi:hypothetical protein
MLNSPIRLFAPLFLIIITLPLSVFGQLERRTADIDESVSLTFMAPRNINLYTVESLSEGELHYSILHTFGPVNSGPRNLWGIDAGANVRFSFEYGITDKISLGLGRSSLDKNIDINLEVSIQPEGKEASIVSKSNYKYMYWNQNQQLAHHTVNGCNMRAGDMYASGTISGSTKDSYGSMLELSWKGSQTVKLNNGDERKFIQDKDTVIMKGHCEKDGIRVGFGEVKAKVLPALKG